MRHFGLTAPYKGGSPNVKQPSGPLQLANKLANKAPNLGQRQLSVWDKSMRLVRRKPAVRPAIAPAYRTVWWACSMEAIVGILESVILHVVGWAFLACVAILVEVWSA